MPETSVAPATAEPTFSTSSNRAHCRPVAVPRTSASILAFVRLLAWALRASLRSDLFAFCLMPNHWHLLLRTPEAADDTEQLHAMAVDDTRAWNCARVARQHADAAPSTRAATDASARREATAYFYRAVRYVERNPVRAAMVIGPTNGYGRAPRRHMPSTESSSPNRHFRGPLTGTPS